MEINHLIVFCGAQIIGMILILLRKKFRSVPNYMLMLILFITLAHYVYYYFFYKGLISYEKNNAFIIIPFATIAPTIVYYYVLSVIYGRLNFTRKSLLHLIPLSINAIIFVFFFRRSSNQVSIIVSGKSSNHIVIHYISISNDKNAFNFL